MEILCQSDLSQSRQIWVYQEWYLEWLATKYGIGTTNHDKPSAETTHYGHFCACKVVGGIHKGAPVGQSHSVAQGLILEQDLEKTGMAQSQGQSRRIRDLGPRENLLRGWVIFNPTCCIPGTRQKSVFKHKLCIHMNKDRKGAQKNEHSLICRAFSIMDDFFPSFI